MNISVFYHSTKKDIKGRFKIFFSLHMQRKRLLIDSGIRTSILPTRAKSGGIGISLDKKEPMKEGKLKALSRLFYQIEEYISNHPLMSLEAAKTAILRDIFNKSDITLSGLIEEHAKKVSQGYSKMLLHTASLVKEFDPKAALNITSEWLERFETFMIDRGLSVNGRSIHLRNIRTVFNQARKSGMTKEYPFLNFKIKNEKTEIKNLDSQQLKALKEYKGVYTDMFFLSLYLAGMNMGDLLLCEKLTNGRMIYRRKKTNTLINIPVHPKALELIEKYKGKKRLLNIMETNKEYIWFVQKMNKQLKKTGVYEGISSYSARYTFASIAAELEISRDIIAACLGHSWADVTSRYIAYSQKQIDDAVKKVGDFVGKL